jgi:hypothetical protein
MSSHGSQVEQIATRFHPSEPSTQRADQVDTLEPLSHRSHPNVAPNVRCHRDDKIADHYDSDSSQRISQSFRHQIPRSLTGPLLHAAGTKSTPRSKVISQSLLRQAATTYNGRLWTALQQTPYCRRFCFPNRYGVQGFASSIWILILTTPQCESDIN